MLLGRADMGFLSGTTPQYSLRVKIEENLPMLFDWGLQEIDTGAWRVQEIATKDLSKNDNENQIQNLSTVGSLPRCNIAHDQIMGN